MKSENCRPWLGPLIWNPDRLPITGGWLRGAPILLIEFSRVSSDGRLTLVIERDGMEIVTRFAVSWRSDLMDAVEDLRCREGPTRREYIGDVVAATHAEPRSIPERIAAWRTGAGLDAAMWTAPPADFQEKQGVLFSVPVAIEYLTGLSGTKQQKAVEYIVCAPEKVQTPLRAAFHAAGMARGWDGPGPC